MDGGTAARTIRAMKRPDAKSILNVMALAAKCGETVTIEVSGEDEEATLQELREFFTANF